MAKAEVLPRCQTPLCRGPDDDAIFPPPNTPAANSGRLTTETVEGTSLSLQGVDDIERCDSLALGVLSVGDGITDDTLEEGLEDSTGLLVDHC